MAEFFFGFFCCRFGETPLHVACRTGKKRVVQLLINFGASLQSKGPDGTPEQTARKYGFEEIANFIQNLSFDPAKVMGKKKSSKSMKRRLNGSGRVNSLQEEADGNSDSSRGSATESTGTDPEDLVAKSNRESRDLLKKSTKKPRSTSKVRLSLQKKKKKKKKQKKKQTKKPKENCRFCFADRFVR